MSTPFSAEASLRIQASPERIWQALTDPAQVKIWLFGTNMSTTWKEGSPVSYKGEWNGKAYEDKGTVLKVVPNRLIKMTYWSAAFGPDAPENYQNLSYEISPEAGGCLLTIRQENAPSAEVAEHSKGNWQMVLKSLKELAEKPA